MKPIHEMTLAELAAYAVTLPSWRWRPGMQCIFPPQTGGCGAICVPRTATLIAGTIKDRQQEVWPYWDVPDGCVPDLDDDATLGCVLAMVREKYGPLCCTYADPELDWLVLDQYLEALAPIKGEAYGYPTEADALIAALKGDT